MLAPAAPETDVDPEVGAEADASETGPAVDEQDTAPRKSVLTKSGSA